MTTSRDSLEDRVLTTRIAPVSPGEAARQYQNALEARRRVRTEAGGDLDAYDADNIDEAVAFALDQVYS